MRRTMLFQRPSEMPEYAAKEMAIIGIVPCLTLTPKGLFLTKFAADNMTDEGKEMISAFLKKMES